MVDEKIAEYLRLLNTCMREGEFTEKWRTELIVPIWKKTMRCASPAKI